MHEIDIVIIKGGCVLHALFGKFDTRKRAERQIEEKI